MPAGERGFTFVAVLAATALLTASLSVAGPRWADAQRRERERELVRVGQRYAQAIAQYRDRSPGAERRYPATLDDLLIDRRFVGTVRHLRRLYTDPVAPGRPWGVVRDGSGAIVGVRSSSLDSPSGLPLLDAAGRPLPAVARYADWSFLAEGSP